MMPATKPTRTSQNICMGCSLPSLLPFAERKLSTSVPRLATDLRCGTGESPTVMQRDREISELKRLLAREWIILEQLHIHFEGLLPGTSGGNHAAKLRWRCS